MDTFHGYLLLHLSIMVADNDIEFTFAIQKIMKNDCVDVNCTQFVEKAFDILMTNAIFSCI